MLLPKNKLIKQGVSISKSYKWLNITIFNNILTIKPPGRGVNEEFVSEMRKVVTDWSLAKHRVISFLFTFLADLSKNSQDTQMNPGNLAICFGPNLCPIPEGEDQVRHTVHVNNLIKNFIVFGKEIFAAEASERVSPSTSFFLPDIVEDVEGRPA